MNAAKEFSAELGRTVRLGHLAAAHASIGELEVGLALLDEAILGVEQAQERLFEGELHRLRGKLLIELGQSGEAEAALGRALAVARSQQARMWELRAAKTLARLFADHGRLREARDLLAPVYGWFTEGFDIPDLKDAKALLNALA
jgi:predicted ATPase